MVAVVSSPSGVILEMRSISMIHHLAGTYADTVAPEHDLDVQGQRKERLWTVSVSCPSATGCRPTYVSGLPELSLSLSLLVLC